MAILNNLSVNKAIVGYKFDQKVVIKNNDAPLLVNGIDVERELMELRAMKRLLIEKGLISEDEIQDIIDSYKVMDKLEGK